MTVYALEGKTPKLAADVFVAPSAAVIGDVEIGEGSSVWFGTVLRGDCYPIRVGARTSVQDNTVVHVTGELSKTTIGDEVTIGHGAIVHGCTIGNRTLVGMGSIILDDAVVGEGCIVAAGAVVPPRAKIPDGSLVMGCPARVVRKVREQELTWSIESARVYQVYASWFKSSGFRVVEHPPVGA